jgi:hypothetical protein
LLLSFDHFRREQHFIGLLYLIKLLAQAKIRTNNTTAIGLSYLVHPITIDGLDGFAQILINFFTAEELNSISFCRFTPAVDYFGGQQHSQKDMVLAFNLIHEKILPPLHAFGIKVKPYYHRLNDLNNLKSYGKCRASGWYVEVAPNADLYLCCEKLFMSPYKIGNLVNESLDNIFNGDERKRIIEKINSTFCSDCPPLCKPHELNKLFNKIEEIRSIDNFYLFEKWKNDLLRLGKDISYYPGKLNEFES